MVDVDELEKLQGLNIFPNPTSGKFTIDYSNKSIPSKIQVFNSIGKLILSFDKQLSQNFEIDLSDCPKGVYYIKSHLDNNFIGQKVIIE